MVKEKVKVMPCTLPGKRAQNEGQKNTENKESLTINTIEEKQNSLLQFVFERDYLLIENLEIILNRNISESNYTVKDIARDMTQSYESLNNNLNRIKSCSIKRYFCKFRMERAKMLLENTSLSISEICYAVGSTNLQSFSRSFKREFGKSPRMIKR